MGFVLQPDRRLRREVRRVAAERLDGAVELLDRAIRDLDGGESSDVDLEPIVHDVRKRCKATRGLARLVKPALGDEFSTFDRTVRYAANELSTLRDAHALIGTYDMLLTVRPDDTVLQDMRRRHIEIADTAGRGVDGGARLETARALLADAAGMSRCWKFGRDVDVIEAGIVATYRQGRSSLRRVRSKPTDHRLHEWRKAVKYLWYQMQLVHDAAPSVLGPLVDELDELSETLGNDHDLAVLIELLDADRGDAHSAAEADHVCTIAREQQAVLRERAIRVGATLYAEADHAFADRIARYWRLAADLGPEPSVDVPAAEPVEPPPKSLVERERKFLVDEPPPHALDADAVAFRQGYLFSDGRGSIRVRDAGPAGCTLTFKAGDGAERTELEWSIARREFDATWPYTDDHRVEKTRRRIADGDHVIELDVFGGDLDGLVLAEVEFESAEALAAFEPPAWFGREVTDDRRYANVQLALSGLPPDTDGTTGV